MSKYVFFFRLANSEDRDSCVYIEPVYDGRYGVNFHGACYCGRFEHLQNLTYEEVETFLNKKDWETLYKEGVSEKDFYRIVKKLESEKGQAFFNEIVESEKEWLKDEYNLDDDDIEAIYNEYSLDYKDRSIVGTVYDSLEDYGENEMWSLGYDSSIPDFIKECIDYEEVGRKLAEDMDTVVLSDNRVVTLCY